MINGVHTLNVLVEVAEERHAQDERWGVQDHPVHTPGDATGTQALGKSYSHLERWIKYLFDQGIRSWALIQLEEIFEALAAPTREQARAEFLQVAAVAVAAVEAIDREDARNGGLSSPTREALLAAMQSSTVPEAFSPMTKETVADTIAKLSGAHPTDPYDAVGGDMEALLKARGALGRAPLCGREAATCEPCPDHEGAPAVTDRRHRYAGEGRLHGICRCGEGRDAPVHQLDPHPFMVTYRTPVELCHCLGVEDDPAHRCHRCSHAFHPGVCPDQSTVSLESTATGPCGCHG